MTHKILIVDDEPSVAAMAVELLAVKGITAEAVFSSREALEKLNSGGYQVLVTDIVMPGMNGIELFRKVQDQFPALEAIFISGSATDATREKLDRLGVFGFIEKPFSADNLAGLVTKALHSNRSLRLGYLSNATTMVGNKGRVLVADDDPNVLNMIADFMGSNGYHVTAVSNGSQAYEKVLLNDYDLIVLDINMPKMDGVETVRAIREHDPHTFILLISGEADSNEIRTAMKFGADKFIPKPFYMKAFLTVVQSIDFPAISLKKKGQTTEMVRTAKRRVSFCGKAGYFLRLRKVSFGILQLFIILLVCLAGGGLAVMLAETKALPQEDRPMSDYMERMINAVKADWGR